MPQIITSKPLLIAIKCMEAVAKYSNIPRTSQKFTNMRREIERKYALYLMSLISAAWISKAL